MCGIALIVDRRGGGVDPKRLAAMTTALAARGPDDEAFVLGDWASGPVGLFGGAATDPADPLPPLVTAAGGDRRGIGLGVRRLAIRDRHVRARQPMQGRGGLWLAFNGELYGVDAIRDELSAIGRPFHTGSDTEVFLAAWEAWGPEGLSRLSGMWAFVVWDLRRRRLWCGRDPLGIKPLYVARTPAAVLIASTPGAIVAGLGSRPAPHAPAVAEYLATGLLDHAASTCFSGIDRIAAGGMLEIGDTAVVERRWAAPFVAAAGRHDRMAHFHEALDGAVASHRAGDRPVGATLSGGLDSGTIVLSAASSPAATPLALFTAGFADPACDERAAAAAVAARTPYPWHVAAIGAPADLGGVTLADDVSTFLAGLDEPVVSSSVYAQWRVMRRAAGAGVRVVLDGQGADELLCGYPALIGPALADDVMAGGPARAWTAVAARAGLGEGSRSSLAARGAVALLPEPLALAAGRLAAAGTSALHPELAASWHAAPPVLPRGTAEEPRTRLAAARARLLVVHLPALLRYLDTSAMAWSVEARVPFLDREVLAAGLALDGDDLWRDGWQKWVLRDARHSRLPDVVRLAPRKRAFAAPEAGWWRGPLRTWLRDVLAPATIARQGLLAPDVVGRALDALDHDRTAGAGCWRWANLTWWAGGR